MRSIIFTLLLSSLWLSLNAQIDVTTKIREATVYLNGAQVTRTGSATLPAGRGTIVLTELTPRLDQQSIRFGATGDFTILSINPRRNFLAPPDASPEVERLVAERKELLDAISLRELEMAVIKEEEAVILANKQVGGKDKPLSVEEIKALASYVGERLKELRTQHFQEGLALRKQRDRLNKLEQQINELGNAQGQNISEVVVQYQSDKAVKADFQVSYLVPNANWSPIYDLRVTDLSQPVNLTYGALVQQNTGEDWKNIEVTLSSGNPRQQQNAPTVKTWWLNPYQPMAQRAKAYDQITEGMAATNAIITMEEREMAIQPGADVSVNLTTTEFKIRAKQDIPNDGQDYRVKVEDYDIAADYQYYAAPRYDKNVYLTARLADWQQYSLVSGPVNLFFDGSYVGRSNLNTQAALDTLVFSLGHDKGISLKRTMDKDYKSRRFLSSKVEQRMGWTIEVKKNRRNNVPIIIEDQIPVSTTDEIEVELERSKGAKLDETTGILRWTLKLGMGESKKVGFRYKVKHPKSMPILLQ